VAGTDQRFADSGVRLRAVESADIDAFYLQQQEPEANRRANSTARARSDFVAHWRDRILGDDLVHARTICDDGRVAGYVVAWWQEDHRCMGYWLGRHFWGRGVGTQAVRQFLSLESMRPLFADTDIGNTASQRLLQRCGFRPVETRRTSSVEYVVFVLSNA